MGAPDAAAEPHMLNDIKVEYHPNSERAMRTYRCEDYKHDIPQTTKRPLLPNTDAWYPFTTRDNFKFSDALHRSAMKEEDICTVLDIVARVKTGDLDFSLLTYNTYQSAWEAAKLCFPEVR